MIEIQILEREILVNSVWIALQNDSIIVLDIDCRTKYPETCGYSGDSFALCASERTIHKGEIPGYTDIHLKLPDGFSISSVQTGRYDVRVYCINDKLLNLHPQTIWETDRK